MPKPNNAPQVNIQRPCYAMASTDGQTADITMYGEIVETQPIDWWTDEPIPGQYIIESEFLSDLQQVENCPQIIIRMDSLIMCACDTVKVNPSSLVMIHKCWTPIRGALNADELRKAAEANDAWDKSQVAIYKRKTGLSETVLLHMMGDTTYMTGKEAIEKGFANELLDDAEPVAISASADRQTIYAKGHALRLMPGVKLPDNIPMAKAATPAAAAANTPAAPAAQSNEGGQSTMANNANPTTATPAAENPQAAVDAAVSAERNRLAEIDSVASLFDPALVQEAKYGETACDARELAFRAAKAAAAQGHEFLKNLEADNAASGAQSVEAVPGASASGSPESLPDAKGNVPKTQAERMAAAEAAVSELLDDNKK